MLRMVPQLSSPSFILMPFSKEPWSQQKFVHGIAPFVLTGSNSKHNILVNPTSKGIWRLYILLHDPCMYPYCYSVDNVFSKSIDRFFHLTGVGRSNIYRHVFFVGAREDITEDITEPACAFSTSTCLKTPHLLNPLAVGNSNLPVRF